MTTYVIAFLIALAVSFITTATVRRAAHRYRWFGHGHSSRNVHEGPIPRVGGLAIVAGFLAPLLGLLLVKSGVGVAYKAASGLVIGLFVGGLAIAALGFYDDVRGANAFKKLSIQIAVATLLWVLGVRIDRIATPWGGQYELGVFGFLVTQIWIVGVINALNLIDGLDGLAGGVALFAIGTSFILAFVRGDILMPLMMASLGGAVLGFLFFNFNPASIFMGDTGSMFLGFVLAVSSIKTGQKSGTAFALLVPVLALGLPIMDTLLAIARRAARGQRLFAADKEHIHHRVMARLSLNHRKAVVLLYGVSCLFGLAALGISFCNSRECAVVLAIVAVIVIALLRKLGYFTIPAKESWLRIRRRNLLLRAIVLSSEDGIREACTPEEVWEALRLIPEVLRTSRFSLRFRRGALDCNFTAVAPGRGAGELVKVAIPLSATGDHCGELSACWADGRSEPDRSEELALESLAGSLCETVIRLARLQGVDGDCSRVA